MSKDYKEVPLVHYAGGNRVQIGTAKVYPNGHVDAQISLESAERIGIAGEVSTFSISYDRGERSLPQPPRKLSQEELLRNPKYKQKGTS